MYKTRYYIKTYEDNSFASRVCVTPEACEHSLKDGYREVTVDQYLSIMTIIKQYI